MVPAVHGHYFALGVGFLLVHLTEGVEIGLGAEEAVEYYQWGRVFLRVGGGVFIGRITKWYGREGFRTGRQT